MAAIQSLGGSDLQAGPGSSGIIRHLAFKGEGFRVLRSRTDPGAVSGWHHHGAHTVHGYVVSGTVRFESGPGGKDHTHLDPGGFFLVPAHTVHRDVNPSRTEGQEMILFLVGAGSMVVNVDGPDPE